MTEARSTPLPGAPAPIWSHSLHEIIDANPVPCFVIDANHVITHWNKGCEQLLGKRAGDMVGTSNQWSPFYPAQRATLADYIVEEAIAEIIDGLYLDKQIRPSPTVQGAYEAVDHFPGIGPEGAWLHFTAAPIHDETGRIIGAVETLQDVTQQRKAEAELRRTNSHLEQEVAKRTAELAETNRQLADNLASAEETSRLKSIFLAAISSELKTPLNGILGFADLIQMDPLDGHIALYAKEIHNSGLILLRLLSDLLTLSEIAAGQAELPEDQFCPQELVGAVAETYRLAATTKGVGFDLHFAERCPAMMTGDGKRLMHCLGCLLDNAVKFTEVGGVTVLMDFVDGQWRITVSDSGPGIPPDAQHMIFEQFTQLERYATPTPGGIGLGLALAKAEAEIMGGSLSVSSQVGAGATFILALPVAPKRRTPAAIQASSSMA